LFFFHGRIAAQQKLAKNGQLFNRCIHIGYIDAMERLTLLEFPFKNKLVQRAAVIRHFALLDRFRKYGFIAQITEAITA